MNRGSFALLVTCVVVAGLGTWFALSRWARVGNVASALVTVAAVGVAVWSAWRTPARSATVDKTD